VILKLFRQSYFVQISGIFVFAILFFIPGFMQDSTNYWPNTTIFLQTIQLTALFKANWIYQLVSDFLLLGLAFYIRSIFKQHQLIHSLNLMPILIILSFFNFQTPFEFQLANTLNLFLIAFCYSFLLQSFEDEKPDNSIFSASLFVSLASFLSYANLTLLPLIWISFFVFQNYSWRYFPISIIGLITPYLFLFTWMFWNNNSNLLLNELHQFYFQLYHIPNIHGLINIIFISVTGFFILSSLSKIIPEIPGKIISIRKKTNLSLWFLLISLYPFLFIDNSLAKNLIIIPLSGLLGYYLSQVKVRRFWIDLIFSIFIIFIVLSKYYQVYA